MDGATGCEAFMEPIGYGNATPRKKSDQATRSLFLPNDLAHAIRRDEY
jgi:hypothetical protein